MPAAKGDRKVLLVRHGRTEMNEYLLHQPEDAPIVDPMLIDARLTPLGVQQATELGLALQEHHDIDLVVTSPMARTLATVQIAFTHLDPPPVVIAHPLSAERVEYGSDIGRERSVLESEFPSVDLSLLPATGGWSAWPAEPRAPVPEEPEDAFLKRAQEFCTWLRAQPGEGTIAVVTHWGIIYALVGEDAANCTVIETTLDELRPGKHLLEHTKFLPRSQWF
jgi:broad specificity phosphatase PhoE